MDGTDSGEEEEGEEEEQEEQEEEGEGGGGFFSHKSRRPGPGTLHMQQLSGTLVGPLSLPCGWERTQRAAGM